MQTIDQRSLPEGRSDDVYPAYVISARLATYFIEVARAANVQMFTYEKLSHHNISNVATLFAVALAYAISPLHLTFPAISCHENVIHTQDSLDSSYTLLSFRM